MRAAAGRYRSGPLRIRSRPRNCATIWLAATTPPGCTSLPALPATGGCRCASCRMTSSAPKKWPATPTPPKGPSSWYDWISPPLTNLGTSHRPQTRIITGVTQSNSTFVAYFSFSWAYRLTQYTGQFGSGSLLRHDLFWKNNGKSRPPARLAPEATGGGTG